MFSKLTTVVSVFLIAATMVLAVPQGGNLPCANDANDVCPPDYTCCGPIIPGIGGTCRKLAEDEMCMF